MDGVICASRNDFVDGPKQDNINKSPDALIINQNITNRAYVR